MLMFNFPILGLLDSGSAATIVGTTGTNILLKLGRKWIVRESFVVQLQMAKRVVV